MERESINDILEEFEAILEQSGVHAALRFLNRRTAHRFTGIYRFNSPALSNVALFDRHNPELRIGEDAPMRETYCSIVGATKAPFATADAQLEESLREHPARENVLSYCGVLLCEVGGNLFGTLCHFDLVPCPIPRHEIPILEAAAPLIMKKLRAGMSRQKFAATPA